ncbi:ATP-dependent RNA helicase dbp7 [Dipsacomyces acuminosporus]|nr:ATP-dependent RNA helicase dbp7 [Dipsacomyces acuminosporus]
MDDDGGLIFNFAPIESSAPVVTVRSKKSGGRWKDRLNEKRKLRSIAKTAQTNAGSGKQHGYQGHSGRSTAQASAGSTDSKAPSSQDREVARLLNEIDGGKGNSSITAPKPAPASSVSLSGQAGKHIVSSLFTSNPEIPSLPSARGHEQSVSSNAVVDTSTFSGLGLEPDVTGYLESKLDITKPTAIQQNAIPILLGKKVAAQSGDDGNGDDAFDIEREVSTEHDVFIQAATGSGKTLTYLLPIFNRLLRASATSARGPSPSRELGTFAIILTPTRELAQQVYETAQSLVNMPLSKSTGRRTHWMVPGIVIGGDKKQSEKGRLRKGVTILACTPGRLLDHLENTKAFVVDNLRWLVLDEADRLLELGFEETLTKILAHLDEKAKTRGRVQGRSSLGTSFELPKRRINVLCSATIKDNVKKLASESLSDPKFISATKIHETVDQAADEAKNSKRRQTLGKHGDAGGEEGAEEGAEASDGDDDDVENSDKFSVPSQLVQKAIIIPAKLRLVTLVAQIKNTFRRNPSSKLMVFLSCKDAVDFMYFLLAHSGRDIDSVKSDSAYADDLFKNLNASGSDGGDDDDDDDDAKGGRGKSEKPEKSGPVLKDEEIALDSSVFAGAKLFRLHGSMLQKRRTETFTAFSKSRHASILFTTDVAARGLDLPNVTSIIQFDPPSDVSSYLHRVGRTARLGRVGEAILFLLPSESSYLALLQEKGLRPDDESMESVLKLMAKNEGAGKAAEWQLRAGEIQAMLERFVVSNITAARLAKQAYLSSIRAYATHISAERHIFHVRFLHFGHVAKSFALRETPNQVASGKGNNQKAAVAKKEKKEKEVAIKKKPVIKRGNDISEFAVGDVSAYYGPRVKRSRED